MPIFTFFVVLRSEIKDFIAFSNMQKISKPPVGEDRMYATLLGAVYSITWPGVQRTPRLLSGDRFAFFSVLNLTEFGLLSGSLREIADNHILK